MNQIGLRLRDSVEVLGAEAPAGEDVISLDRLLAMARRQRWGVIVATTLAVVIGVVYVATTPAQFYASSRVLIDDRLNKIVEDVAATSSILRDDTALSNQIEVLRSEQVALAVVEALQLYDNATFYNPPVSLASRVGGAISGSVGGTLDRLEGVFQPEPVAVQTVGLGPEARLNLRKRALAGWLQNLVQIRRIGRSHVIEIGFENHDPRLAAALANAYAEAYLADQLNASFDATQRTTDWLENRLGALYASSQSAALEVEQFRAENGLSATDGQLITEQKLAQLNTQLASAEAEAARAEALMDAYRDIVARGTEGLADFATVSPNLTNDTRLAGLQEQYVTVSTRLSIVTQDFGAAHPQARLLRAEQAELSDVIFTAFNRLLQQARGEYTIAQRRVEALRASVLNATTENSVASQSQVKLRELQQRADTLSSLYEGFLERYEQIEQRSSFPVSNVRVLTSADTPQHPIAPSATKALSVALVLGLFVGILIGLWREWRERYFRTGDQVAQTTGLRFLGYLPRREGASRRPFWARWRKAEETSAAETRAPLFVSIQAPQSMFTETLRNVRIACDLTLEGEACKLLGISSVLPGEGKSTVASNLANLLSMAGHRTLLIDADMRNPGLSRALGVETGAGLVEIGLGEAAWQDSLRTIGVSKLHVVPCIARRQLSHSSELLQSAQIAGFLEEARARYDYVIVDLPPMGAVVDTKALLPRLHKLIFVAEWGRTPRALVRQLLSAEPLVRSKTVGLVLNRVEMEALPAFSGADRSEAFLNSYGPYLKAGA